MMLARFSLMAVLVLGVVVVACSVASPNASSNPTSRSGEGGPHLPSAFTVSRIADFSEAARVAGFDIPISDVYPLHWGYLFIQPGVESGTFTPRKVDAIYDLHEFSVYVTMAPLSFWQESALRDGDGVDYGGRRGWVRRDTHGVKFLTPLSNSERFGEIWMLVQAPRDGELLMESFVASLKLPSQ